MAELAILCFLSAFIIYILLKQWDRVTNNKEIKSRIENEALWQPEDLKETPTSIITTVDYGEGEETVEINTKD